MKKTRDWHVVIFNILTDLAVFLDRLSAKASEQTAIFRNVKRQYLLDLIFTVVATA